MGLFTKVFGPSKLQEEFNKANALKWFLIVEKIKESEYSFNDSSVIRNFANSMLIFDFANSKLVLTGDIVLGMSSCFRIIRSDIDNSNLVFYLSEIDDYEIIIACRILRNSIYIEGTRKNWFAKFNVDQYRSLSS